MPVYHHENGAILRYISKARTYFLHPIFSIKEDCFQTGKGGKSIIKKELKHSISKYIIIEQLDTSDESKHLDLYKLYLIILNI